MDRRIFLKGSGTAAALMSAAASAAAKPSATSMSRTASVIPEAAPGQVAASFADLLEWMHTAGWGALLSNRAGFDIAAALVDEAELFRPLDKTKLASFPEFAGTRAIQPGDPAMSLLYHLLAASPVTLDDAPANAYPSLVQIDALENYIYARAPRPADFDDLIPAVFAFEYRQAAKTPHQRHADLVFARAGVARAGDRPGHYDRVRRSFIPEPVAEGEQENTAVLPARYGLFLARRMRDGAIEKIALNSRDDDLDFLLPVRKLFSGSADIGGANLQFSQFHRDEKLFRLSTIVDLPADEHIDTRKPPFIRVSASKAMGGKEALLPENTSHLVTLDAMAGSALLWPNPAPLVKQAFQDGKPCKFRVEPETGGTGSNRRYTSLRLIQKPGRLAQNFIYSDIIFAGGRRTTGFRAPQNIPAFVNIRHRVEADGSLTHLGEHRSEVEQIQAGGYWAAMFLDNLCDGCVTAEVIGGGADSAPLLANIADAALPAFSLVAAPDFFPQFDPNDLRRYDHHFMEGGTETASGGRQRANPAIKRPHQPDVSAFPIDPEDTLTETMTAVVSASAEASAPTEPVRTRRYWTTNCLPDTISFVFAPGWDVSYSNGPDHRKITYLASYGLGSPFPEDMKLCAVANGMWAGSSPDASRTFFPDLIGFPILGRPATAVPLLDSELGYHPASPAVMEHGIASRHGWDGEYGPFLRVVPTLGGGARFGVDFPDMLLSDYVTNARGGTFDLGRMRRLSTEETLKRMDALARCIRKLPGFDRVRSTEMWLVSAVAVPSWEAGAEAPGVPRVLALHNAGGRISAAPGITGAGWLYVFARARGKPADSDIAKRRYQPCRAFYVCQVADEMVRYCKLELDHLAGKPSRWR